MESKKDISFDGDTIKEKGKGKVDEPRVKKISQPPQPFPQGLK